MVGNTLEYFDFYLYIHLAFILQKHFFPTVQEGNAAMITMAMVASYFFTPIAGLIWGAIGDLQGRKKVLVLSSVIMSISTFFVTLIPDYNWWSNDLKLYPVIILFLLRITQSIAMAGEPLSSKLYAAECNDDTNGDMPLNMAKMGMTNDLGGVLALATAYVSLNLINWEQAWRIPFILAFFSTLFIAYVRHFLADTNEYLRIAYNKPAPLWKAKFYEVVISLRSFKKSFFSYSILVLSYSSVFFFNYTFISKMVIKECGYTQDFLITYNLFVVFGEFLCNYIMVWIPIKMNWNKKITMAIYHLIAMCCVVTFMLGVIGMKLPLWCYITLQITIMATISWNLVLGSILKSFPVMVRFSLLATSVSTAKITFFLLFVIIFPHIFDMTDIKQYGYICLCIITLAMISLYFYTPYETIEKEAKIIEDEDYQKAIKLFG